MMRPARPIPSNRRVDIGDISRLSWFPGSAGKAGNKKPARPRLGRAGRNISSNEPAALFRLQFQGRRIDAVTQSGRAGAVLEHVAEMAVALRAQHLGPEHAVADVALLVDMALDRGCGEARPAAAGIEFGVGFEQRLAAAGAGVGARRLLVLVFAGEWPLGRLLAQHRVLHRRQFLAPLDLVLFDLAGHRLGKGHETSLQTLRVSTRSGYRIA